MCWKGPEEMEIKMVVLVLKGELEEGFSEDRLYLSFECLAGFVGVVVPAEGTTNGRLLKNP